MLLISKINYSMDDLKIKHMMPSKKRQYKQGIIDPKTLKKYASAASNQPVIYRSGLELQFIHYCEVESSIAKWASEPVEIKYASRLDHKEHCYYPDYIIESKSGQRTVIEIKPYNQTIKPRPQDSLWLKEAWVKNIDKWKAAKAWAESKGMKFMVVTENFFK